MRPSNIKQLVKNRYPPEKMQEIASALAREISDLEQVRNDKKVSDKAFNEQIERHTTTATELAGKYNRGYEMIEMDCDIRYNSPEPGKKEFIRMDTNESVSILDMNWEEKQEELQLNLPPTGDASSEPSKSDIAELKDKIDQALGENPPRILPSDSPPQPPEDIPF